MFGSLTFKDTKYEQHVNDTETKCLLCEDSFNLTLSLHLFITHIFEVHNVVVEDVQDIKKLNEYVQYWRNKLKSNAADAIIPSITIDSTNTKYFLLSSLLKEDKLLRHKLKLEHTMEVQEFERTDKNYVKNCLFCRFSFTGTRPDYLKHLSDQHNLQLGNPQNLVHIEELVDKIDSKLNNLLCIYCEKTFPERNILKEHMRKKLHKRINPQNTEYDKYYMINYLEPEKTWQSIQKEDDNYAIPVEFKKTIPLKELELGKPYIIKKIRKVSTTFGDALVAELEEVQVFLPKRIVNEIDEDHLEEFNHGN